jgi:hypothetical protein
MVGDVKLGVLTILNLWIFFMKDTLRFTIYDLRVFYELRVRTTVRTLAILVP